MILKTEILFNDNRAEKIGIDPEFIWYKGAVDISKVTAYYVFVDNNIAYDFTSLLFDSGKELVVKVPFKDIDSLMDEYENIHVVEIENLSK